MTTVLHRDQVTSTGRPIPPIPAQSPQACAVRLIDRRTGQTHRINGSPLVLFTRDPQAAVSELLSGRDTTVWEARVEPIGTPARKDRGRE